MSLQVSPASFETYTPPFLLASTENGGVYVSNDAGETWREEHTSELQSQSNLVCRLLRSLVTSALFTRTYLHSIPRRNPHLIHICHCIVHLVPTYIMQIHPSFIFFSYRKNYGLVMIEAPRPSLAILPHSPAPLQT